MSDSEREDHQSEEQLNPLIFARHSLLAYAVSQWEGYNPAWHHKVIAQKLEAVERGEIKRLMIFVPPRHGKLVADSIPILTINGWKTHGDLVVGDYVFSPDGNPIKVTSISKKDIASIDVELTNGDIIKVHPNHEWTVFNRSKHKVETLETKKLLNLKLIDGNIGKRGGRYVIQVPNISALNFPNIDLIMKPYSLGAWLGDGSSSKSCITHDKNDYHVIDGIINDGYKVSTVCTHKQTGVLTTYFAGDKPNVLSDFGKHLRLINVLNNKHIPEEYFKSSINQRLELLAGLIDTDGHVDNKSRVRFTTSDKKLADDVYRLVSELGMRPYVTEVEPTLSSSGIQGKKVVYVIGFQPTIDIPTKIPRKKITRLICQRKVSIKSVVISKYPEYGHCIQVDSNDGLYLVGKNLTPTHNSQLSSEFFPAWYLGRNPDKYIITATYSQELAEDFGRKVRNQLQDIIHQTLFPECRLSPDSQSSKRFSTLQRGTYFAVGVGSSITGRGANVLIIDDPIKNREEADSETIRRKVRDWYTSTAYTRLMPNGAVIVIQTRWHEDDLSGWLLSEHAHEKWDVVDLPAINDKGEALWPDYYPIKSLEQIKRTIGERDWSALYQQKPTTEGGNILKSHWWRIWPDDKKLPVCEHIFPSWDTAYSTQDYKDTSFSACTRWGIFWDEMENRHNIMLLGRWAGRVDYPTLRQKAIDISKNDDIDCHLIEKKASGQSLIQDLRTVRINGQRIMVRTYQPDRDKISRAYAVQEMLRSGQVFIPNKDWAFDFIDMVSKFPSGAPPCSDYTDTITQALLYLRNGLWVKHPDDIDYNNENSIKLSDEQIEDLEDNTFSYYG